MKDATTTFSFDLDDLDRSTWIERVEDISEEYGHVHSVGIEHMALFIDVGRTLLVSFESIAGIRRQNDDTAPVGWGFAQSHGWSSLTLLAQAEMDWFRHPAIFSYFDRMIDDGFFDDFDQVLFYGAGSAGYAAAAFSVAAPEANVLVIQPQATLEPSLARWDRRFPEARREDFKTRYGYAPMMVETASQVTVLHDPTVTEDAMHATLFNGTNTTQLTAPYVGPNAQRALLGMDVLPEMIEQAMNATLTSDSYAQLWRARRNHMPYLRTLMHRLDADEHHERLLARLCRFVIKGGDRPKFANKLAELEARGVTL